MDSSARLRPAGDRRQAHRIAGLVGTLTDCRARVPLVDLDEDFSNQVFAELDKWEHILKDTSLAQPKPPEM